MRGNHLPSGAAFDPHICKAVVIRVRFAAGVALFVIDAGNPRRVTVHPNVQVGHFSYADVRKNRQCE